MKDTGAASQTLTVLVAAFSALGTAAGAAGAAEPGAVSRADLVEEGPIVTAAYAQPPFARRSAARRPVIQTAPAPTPAEPAPSADGFAAFAAARLQAEASTPAPAAPAPAEPVSADPAAAVPQNAPAPTLEATATTATTAGGETPRRNINPYDRDIAMTVPLNFNRRILGEMPVILTRDDRFLVESEGFQALIGTLLTQEAQAELGARLAGVDNFAPEEIGATGIQLDYDPDQLAVLVLRIDPTKRSMESLFDAGQPDEPGLPPRDFTAYLNSNLVAQRRASTGEVAAPAAFLNGAVRYRRLVLESDFQGREDLFTGEYLWERNYARFVFDEPKQFRRWYAGDLDPELSGRQGFVELGGFGVQRQRRRFDSFQYSQLTGARPLVLQEGSTVRVTRNGILLREFQLDPGQYDLSDLPLLSGSNDIELEVRGIGTGQVQNIAYSAYRDPIDLDPGDYEYGAYLGYTSNRFAAGSPDYSAGEIAFTGYFRKAFINAPAVGLGLQASERVQVVTGQSQLILRNGARLLFDGAASNGDAGAGYAFTTSYDHFIDLGETFDSWAVTADYTSENFATLGNEDGLNQTKWIFTGSYTHRFNVNLFATAAASYRIPRNELESNAYVISTTVNYRFRPRWSVQVGAEMVDYGGGAGSAFGGSRDGFGVTVGLVWQPRFDRRGDARYSSATNTGAVSFQQYAGNRVGAIGYGVNASYNDGAGNVSGQVDYTANRFDTTLSHTAFGRSFSDITEEQVTSLRIGSSVALAGGKFAIGRNIYDSFAIVHPHESLKGSTVIVGDSFENGRYQGRSGVLGPALSNNLTSYIDQSVRYDALNAPLGYNVGEGVVRVRPTYKSGYAIEVGSANFVSAMGRLVGEGEKPVALMSGRIVPIDVPDAETDIFFTNSAGRFAIQNLQPGKRYRVELYSDPPLAFEFTVPEDNEGLLNLQTIAVPLIVPEN